MAKIRKTVKMSDIAEKLNVSTVTVSKALSGQKGVSEEMREKIRALAEEMGYKAPGTSKERETRTNHNLGVLISDRYLGEFDTFYWRVYQEVVDIASQFACFTMFEILSEEMEINKQIPRLVEEKRVDGLIIIGKPGSHYEKSLIGRVDMPLIFLDFYETDSNVDCVISDGFYGTYVLTDYLIKKGHKDIAYVGTLFATESITDRYLGYVKALMEHGINVNPDYLIKDRDIESGLRDQYSVYNFPNPMPTAFVCNCDFIASLIIKSLQEKGYRVPEDISVVGYDNYLYPGLCDVDITTYEVNIRAMAKEAIDTLVRKIEKAPYKPGIHIVEGHFVEKKSVAERK